MLAKNVRQSLNKLLRLAQNVLDRPHEHVARERLHYGLQRVLGLLAQRKRPYASVELTDSVQRFAIHATTASNHLSSARNRWIIDASVTGYITAAVKDLSVALDDLRLLSSLNELPCKVDRKGGSQQDQP